MKDIFKTCGCIAGLFVVVTVMACMLGLLAGSGYYIYAVITTPAALAAESESARLTPEVPAEKESPKDSTEELYVSPVKATDTFNKESAWLIAEPGVILDDTAAWVIPSVDAKHFVNIPEGGFTYFSMGEGAITINGETLNLPPAEGLNYLVLVRGPIDDGIVDSDLNLTGEVTKFVPAHAIWSIMPPGAYVSKGWFSQQMVTSTTTGGTNCGATGCTRLIVVLFDADTLTQMRFELKASDLNKWLPIGNQ